MLCQPLYSSNEFSKALIFWFYLTNEMHMYYISHKATFLYILRQFTLDRPQLIIPA